MNVFPSTAPTAIEAQTFRAFTARSSASGSPTLTGTGSMELYGGLDRNDPEGLIIKFQSVLFTEMLKAMRATVPESELFGDDSGRDMFQSFLDEQYVEKLSENMQSAGLTDALRYQLGLSNASEPEKK